MEQEKVTPFDSHSLRPTLPLTSSTYQVHDLAHSSLIVSLHSLISPRASFLFRYLIQNSIYGVVFIAWNRKIGQHFDVHLPKLAVEQLPSLAAQQQLYRLKGIRLSIDPGKVAKKRRQGEGSSREAYNLAGHNNSGRRSLTALPLPAVGDVANLLGAMVSVPDKLLQNGGVEHPKPVIKLLMSPTLAQVVESDTGGFQIIDKFAAPENVLAGHAYKPHEQKVLKAEAMLGIKRLFEEAAQLAWTNLSQQVKSAAGPMGQVECLRLRYVWHSAAPRPLLKSFY